MPLIPGVDSSIRDSWEEKLAEDTEEFDGEAKELKSRNPAEGTA